MPQKPFLIFEPTSSQRAAALRLLENSLSASDQKTHAGRYAQWLELPPEHGFTLTAIGDNPASPLAAGLVQVLPGKVALLWPPGVQAANNWIDAVPQLLAHVHQHLAADGVQLSQLLLPESESQSPLEIGLIPALEVAGYRHLARLLYLYASDQETPFPQTPPVARLCQIVPAGKFSPEQLQSLIEETYIDTQDCPQMSGLRSPDQVLQGYRRAGTCEDRFWFVATSQSGSPLGCLLLAPDTAQQTCELVYVGVIPSARGLGLAGELLSWAKWQTKASGCSQLLLAVDDQNLPGLKLYQRQGFQSFDARVVYVKSLTTAPSP